MFTLSHLAGLVWKLKQSWATGRDNICEYGQIAVIGDAKGDGNTACQGGKKRAYCCDPAGDSYSPVPWKDLFDTNADLDGDAMAFDVEFDQDEDSRAGQYDSEGSEVGAGTSSDMPDNEDENDEAFGEVRLHSMLTSHCCGALMYRVRCLSTRPTPTRCPL